MQKKYMKFILFVIIAAMCVCAGCGKKSGDSVISPESPAANENTSTDGNLPNAESPGTTDSIINSVPEITIDEAVSDEVKESIDFDVYTNQRAYELQEKDTEPQIKLIYPVNIYRTDVMDVKYHVDIVNADDGSVVLQVLGTDFTVTKTVSEIKVEWQSVGLKVMPTEKVYKFKGLCITIDGEVYFYEDTFYSPFIEGREITYTQISE
ncbi:MAG: hypothetical protein IJZ94_00105 [Clostridia bacterium]|nr:hypothetical protein [Clostridia bacterium]